MLGYQCQFSDFRIYPAMKPTDLQTRESPSIFVGVLGRVPSNTYRADIVHTDLVQVLLLQTTTLIGHVLGSLSVLVQEAVSYN